MSYQVHDYNKMRHHKSTGQSIVEGFFIVLWTIISFPFKLIFGKKNTKKGVTSGGGLDRGYIDSKWQEIEQLIHLGSPSNYSRAVLEGDKLLDHILKGYRAPGVTMGDRLKASQNRFSPEGYDAAWKAHKVRNELVHNSQFEITDYVARPAIENFKRAMDELI